MPDNLPDKTFHDKLAAKIFTANKQERKQQTEELKTKLDELKSTGEVKVTEIPQDFQQLMADWTMAAQFVKALSESLKVRGEKGDPGKAYVITEADKQEIAAKIKVPVVEKIVERTEVVKEQPIVTEVTKVTNEVKEVAVAETADQITEKLQSLKNAWLEISAIKGFEEYMRVYGSNFLEQAKAFVPRSFSALYDVDLTGLTDGQSPVYNKASGKWKPGTPAASGSLASETPSGSVDGSNPVFSVSNTPVFVTVNGQVLAPSGVDYTYSGGTITFVTPPETGSILMSFHN